MSKGTAKPTRATIYKKYGNAEQYTAKTVRKAMIAELVYLFALKGEEDTPKNLFTDEERAALKDSALSAGLADEYMNTYELMEYLQYNSNSCLDIHKFLCNTVELISAYYNTVIFWASMTAIKEDFLPSPILKRQKKDKDATLSSEIALLETYFGNSDEKRHTILNYLNKLQLFNTKVALIASDIGVPELAKVLHFDMDIYASMIGNKINSAIEELFTTLVRYTNNNSFKAYASSDNGRNLLTPFPVRANDIEYIIPVIHDLIKEKNWHTLSLYTLPEV